MDEVVEERPKKPELKTCALCKNQIEYGEHFLETQVDFEPEYTAPKNGIKHGSGWWRNYEIHYVHTKHILANPL